MPLQVIEAQTGNPDDRPVATNIIMHGLGLNITIQTYAGRVDFGIIADKKALPHASDFAKAVEAAFAEAQALMATAQPVIKNPVAKATEKTKLGKPPTVKTKPRRDTVLKSNTAPTFNAPNHGKTVIKNTARSKTARRPIVKP